MIPPMLSEFLLFPSILVSKLIDHLASSFGKSEEIIGEWAEARGIRDQLFIATKVGTSLSFVETLIPDLFFLGHDPVHE